VYRAVWVLIAGCAVGQADEQSLESVMALPLADGFDFPVGAPDAAGYRNAQGFGVNYHLGEDWNGVLGGESDLGDPVYAIAHGRVTSAEHRGEGWGNVVRIGHRVRGIGGDDEVESFYAHLDRIDVEQGDIVFRGQPIGTIGNADGAWHAHLHLELRRGIGAPDGRGYSDVPRGWLDPTVFIENHRPLVR